MANFLKNYCDQISDELDNREIFKYFYKIKNSHSIHSSLRSQQRCIPNSAIELVLDYGRSIPVGRGAESYSFDNRSWRKACADVGTDVRQYEKYRNIYVVIAGGTIVTVAWRH
ncbi:MAG: hypothetical protein ACOYKQ_01900 [Polymorphobacter sp.]